MLRPVYLLALNHLDLCSNSIFMSQYFLFYFVPFAQSLAARKLPLYHEDMQSVSTRAAGKGGRAI